MPKSAFGFKQPEDSPGFLLWQVTMSWQRAIKVALEPYKMTHPQFVIMALLLWFTEQESDPIQSEIIEKSKLDKMTVSGSIKKLVSLGYIKRSECQQDTRAKVVVLTKSGINLTRKLVAMIESIDREFFSKIDKTHRLQLIRIMKLLSE